MAESGQRLFIKVVSRHDLSRQLVGSQSNRQSFPGGAGYPTYWVFIPVGRIV